MTVRNKRKDPVELGLEHFELFPVQLSCGFKVQSKNLPTLSENEVLLIETYQFQHHSVSVEEKMR